MLVTFDNVSISLEADSPKEAYKMLQEHFAEIGIDWTSDTYRIGKGLKARDVSKLIAFRIGM